MFFCQLYVDVFKQDWILLAASRHKHMTYTSCCIYKILHPDDEQKACSKHVEVIYQNKTESN
jgi:hypothetical protein